MRDEIPVSYTPSPMYPRTNPRPRRPLRFGVVACLLISAPIFAQDSTPSRAAAIIDSMPHAKKISEAALSPDAMQVAYIVDDKLTVTTASGGAPQSIAVEGNLPLRDVVWSADSKRLAFLADLPGDVPSAQIWIAAADGSAPAKHAELKGYVQAPRFSPDGSKFAILFIEGMPRVAGPLQPMTPLAGVIDEKIYEQRITILDLGNDHLTQVTPADVYVYEYDWTPDGQGWAATASHGSGDANWWIARLYTVNAHTGEMREIYKPKLQIAGPQVSPDGKSVAFIEGLMSDEGSTGGDIYVVPIAVAGAARNLTPNIKASPDALVWTAADRITFAESIDGNSGFGTVTVHGSAIQQLWSGEESASPESRDWVSGSPDGAKLITAIVRQSPSAPPEVWAGPIGAWKQLTEINASAKPIWGNMRNVHWTNGTTQVQGWLLMPKDFSSSKTYPLVVSVHG